MRSRPKGPATAAAAFLVALTLTACGGSGGTDEAPSSEARTGGEATFYYASFPDFLDPALAFTVEGIQALQVSYLPLLSYRREAGAAGAQLIPALAEAMPEVSADGRTYRLRLRAGLVFSDGTPVRASDFEHTVKRVLRLESNGASFFQVIAGATKYLEAGEDDGDISGIDTDDATRDITIRLDEPNGQFPFILALDYAALVPGDTPFENATKRPPPGTGPFTITEVDGTREFVLERNRRYTPLPGIPAAKLDRITVQTVKNQQRQIQDVLRNSADYASEVPAGDALRRFRAEAPERLRTETTNSTYYFFLNHRVEPFDDVRVRQAVGTAVDEAALQRIFGGLLTPTCNFLPPGMEGYEAVEPCPFGTPGEPPDLERARQMVRDAGAEGAQVTVWGNDEDPSSRVTNYLADTLGQIGFDARPRIIEGSVYFSTIGNQKTEAQAGFDNWFQDFPHPGNFMSLVDGENIQATNNPNFGNVEDPEIDRTLNELDEQELSEAAAGWAQVDRRLIEQAHVIPYGNRDLPLIVSDRIAFDQVLFHPVLQADYATFALTR